MKDIIKHFVIGLVIGLIASGLMVWGYNVGKRHSSNTVDTITDTITLTDTITDWNYDTMYLSHFDTIKLPVIDTVNDTIIKIDSVLVQIPISTYTFDTTITDTNYRTSLKAITSGFAVTMDSLYLNTEIIENKPIPITKKWYNHIVPAVGVGFGTGGFGVFAGVGLKIF